MEVKSSQIQSKSVNTFNAQVYKALTVMFRRNERKMCEDSKLSCKTT